MVVCGLGMFPSVVAYLGLVPKVVLNQWFSVLIQSGENSQRVDDKQVKLEQISWDTSTIEVDKWVAYSPLIS